MAANKPRWPKCGCVERCDKPKCQAVGSRALQASKAKPGRSVKAAKLGFAKRKCTPEQGHVGDGFDRVATAAVLLDGGSSKGRRIGLQNAFMSRVLPQLPRHGLGPIASGQHPSVVTK
jgi:hypothetical protein